MSDDRANQSFDSIQRKKMSLIPRIVYHQQHQLRCIILYLCSSLYCIKSANHTGELKSSLLTESLMTAKAFSFLQFHSSWHARSVWQSTACLLWILLGKTTKSSQLRFIFYPSHTQHSLSTTTSPKGLCTGTTDNIFCSVIKPHTFS